ncbi:MAG: hypothetical protein A3G18_05140 [Rhodospirillales bacterium RIFCSPLOWO2_12_FULL_58_28]|nr:MAG: hypothetical protein A3H92_05235 [Rhodospirillales bacterium RIFCSPLOWO2_02_FULL_58_16]OHC78295.1 MAG: hypothetical protein A3G18_05140 [Rhodospirillales bacterium RIFCSPLOWO2_12_FULL_58_28]
MSRKLRRNREKLTKRQNLPGANKDIAPFFRQAAAAFQAGRFQEALDICRRIIAVHPRHSGALGLGGIAAFHSGDAAQAEEYLRAAVKAGPGNAEAHNELGAFLAASGRIEDAVACFRRAVEIMPDHADAHFNLGALYLKQENLDAAEAACRRAVTINPDHAGALLTMGRVYNRQCKFRDALECFERSFKITRDPKLKMIMTTSLPHLMPPMEELIKIRNDVKNKISIMAKEKITNKYNIYDVSPENYFHIAYHGFNDKDSLSDIGDFYINSCPELAWESPHCFDPVERKGKLRLGIVSSFLFKHTIGVLFRGLIEKLSRDKFEVMIFRPHGDRDGLADHIDRSADKVFYIPTKVDAARELIAAQKPDILLYPDIGMTAWSYSLAFSRLAPVQAVTMGHPITTGIPNVDYFLSIRSMEPDNAEDHYRERLIKLEHFPSYFYPPEIPDDDLGRRRFGFADDAVIYVCPQNLTKFHPEFDHTLGEILRADPKGILVLIDGAHREWREYLLERFALSFADPDLIDRIIFLPNMPNIDFLRLLIIADAVLDTSHFCGGKSSLETFAMGVPIVTWPGKTMRGRVTSGFYRAMGFTDLIAENEQDYVRSAVRLANDGEFHNRAREQIREKAGVLFENMESVRELERFFITAVESARRRKA